MTAEVKHMPKWKTTRFADGTVGIHEFLDGSWVEVATLRGRFAEKNAVLAATAPDLLAALKDAMRSSRKDFKLGVEGDRQHREAYAEQFAAISRATGAS